MSLRKTQIICGIGLLLTTTSALGQYDLSWRTIDGGGYMHSAGGDFELSGTIGQPDACTVLAGGDFELAAGFWPGVEPLCLGDLDGDGQVGLVDLGVLLANYGQTSGMTYADGDLDGDGDVDLADLGSLLAHYGEGC